VEPEIRVEVYRRITEDGAPHGRGQELVVQLREKTNAQGRLIWFAAFEFDVAANRYLDVTAIWPERGVCAPGNEVAWSFHVASQ
jgi:hypothetical protein